MRIRIPLVILPLVGALDLNIASISSLRDSSSTLAFNVLSSYSNNASDVPQYQVGVWPSPTYWWQGGAAWGGLVDYWAYTADETYNPSVVEALIAQAGVDGNLMPQQYRASMGNDDIAFWALAALSALEYGLPFPGETENRPVSSWLQLVDRVFNGMASRWNTARCAGGLKWQVYAENDGYHYKNAVSNGAFFQIAARLARYTGNSTYYDWAERVWDWSASIGLIDQSSYAVYDGSDDAINCTELDHTQWSYNPGLYMGGAAYLYNATNGSSIWGDRALYLLTAANTTFFSPFDNATGIIYEQFCELRPRQTGREGDAEGGCNQDQLMFKGFLGRWMGKSAIVAPFLAPLVAPLLSASASGAAIACSGWVPGASSGGDGAFLPGLGRNATLCGQHFYSTPERTLALSQSGYFSDLTMGQKLGHHLSALETVLGNIPIVDTRREDEGGPRSMRVADGVTIASAPMTTAVLPTALPESTLGTPGDGDQEAAGSSVKGVGTSWAIGVVGVAIGLVL